MGGATIRLWDPVVRVFHASVAGAFFANYLFTEEGDAWHTWLGYYACFCLLVRVPWGFIGPRSARWRDFWPTLGRLAAHLRALRSGAPHHRLGHSPLGALVMILMMLSMALLGLTGYLMQEVDALWGAEWPEDAHRWIANGLALLVSLHMAAAVFESLRVRDNLPLSMITGRRRPLPGDDEPH